MSDEADGDAEELDNENTQRRKRRALPNNFERAGREVQIEILRDFEISDLPALCLTSKTFAAQFCGTGGSDAVGLLDRDIVYEHWQAWLARDYGVAHDPNLCAAFSPLERQLVAESMQRAIDLSAEEMTNWLRLRGLASLYRRLLAAAAEDPLRVGRVWGYRDGIVVIDVHAVSRRQKEIRLISVIDAVHRENVGATRHRHILLHAYSPKKELASVKMANGHTGLYLISLRSSGNEDDNDDNDADDDTNDEMRILVFLHETNVITASVHVPQTLSDVMQAEMYIDPLQPHQAYIQIHYPSARTDAELRTLLLDANADNLQSNSTHSRWTAQLRTVRELFANDTANSDIIADVFLQRAYISTSPRAYVYETGLESRYFTAQNIYSENFQPRDRIFIVPVVRTFARVQADRFSMRVVIARRFVDRFDAEVVYKNRTTPLQITTLQFDSVALDAVPARAIHYPKLLMPSIANTAFLLSPTNIFGTDWVAVSYYQPHFDDSDLDSDENRREILETETSLMAFDFVRGVLKQTFNTLRVYSTVRYIVDDEQNVYTTTVFVPHKRLVGLNSSIQSHSFGAIGQQLNDEMRVPAQIENAKS